MHGEATSDRIFIDWGTTNARAYRVGPDGEVRARRHLAQGIRKVAAGGFPAAFAALLGPWVAEQAGAPILMQGMVGSRQGWVEIPYCPCPVRSGDLAGRLGAVPDHPELRIVPGVCRAGADGTHHDVMRGEETQALGAIEAGDAGPAVVCLPGTHSKWVLCRDGGIADFATAMTGEVFEVMRSHSLLGALMPREGEGEGAARDTGEAFRRGLDRSGEEGGLLHHLFGVRAEGLFDTVPASSLADFLSGILIGHEVRAMAARFSAPGPVRLVADGVLAARYAEALGHLGLAVDTVDAERATVRGLSRILEAAARLA